MTAWPPWARRLVAVALFGLAALLALAGPAAAHPLGNFTINHISRIAISDDEVTVRYVLDVAEIPTFQERRLSEAQSITAKTRKVLDGLELTVDGRTVALAPKGPATLEKPDGQGGLKTTRFELELRAAVAAPRRVALRDETFAGRIGWRAIVLEEGDGTAVRSTDAFSSDPTDELRRYPVDLLQTPLDQRSAAFVVEPGDGTVDAPAGPGGETRAVDATGFSGDGFAAVFDDAAAGNGVLLLLLLASFAWGAFHALSPGHGKVMVAAYLVGTRGTARDAVALGAIVTVTHTIGVFALGFVTLALSQYILPEELYPYLNLTAGLLIVGVGLAALRSRSRGLGHHAHEHANDHDHEHSHAHDHDHAHDHSHAHDHAAHVHSHGGRAHSHLPPEDLSARGLLGMGAAAGLIPCPSALVVLLGAISQQEILLGLLLITVFSLGLAGTLTVLGLVVVHSRARVPAGRGGRVVRALPVVSALIILVVGVLLTLKAVPTLS